MRLHVQKPSSNTAQRTARARRDDQHVGLIGSLIVSACVWGGSRSPRLERFPLDCNNDRSSIFELLHSRTGKPGRAFLKMPRWCGACVAVAHRGKSPGPENSRDECRGWLSVALGTGTTPVDLGRPP